MEFSSILERDGDPSGTVGDGFDHRIKHKLGPFEELGLGLDQCFETTLINGQ